VNLHSVFLRLNCVLPDSVDIGRHAFGKRWSRVEGLSSLDLDVIIRHAGWHYIWLTGDNSCRSWSRTSEVAIDKALTRALTAVPHDCNAAEIDSIKMATFAGFWIANVTLQGRRIQQSTFLEAEAKQMQALHSR
jgi:hypothetical protein